MNVFHMIVFKKFQNLLAFFFPSVLEYVSYTLTIKSFYQELKKKVRLLNSTSSCKIVIVAKRVN